MSLEITNLKARSVPVDFCRVGCVLVFISIFMMCLTINAFAGDVDNAEHVPAGSIPRPDHVVIVIEENKSFEQIIDNQNARYINSLAKAGALFTRSFGVTHPSQPNYLALFSGSTHGINDDGCPLQLSGDNLASELIKNGLSFGIYSESMPSAGYEECYADKSHYARKHNPAVNWQGKNLPAEINMTIAEFPADYTKLPTVSMVIPNQINDMHDGWNKNDSIKHGDDWLGNNLDAYVQWAKTHNSLLLVTWDEDDNSSNNHIPTIFVGPMIKSGLYDNRIDHYSVLRTLEEIYGLSLLGKTVDTHPIQNIWSTGNESASRIRED